MKDVGFYIYHYGELFLFAKSFESTHISCMSGNSHKEEESSWDGRKHRDWEPSFNSVAFYSWVSSPGSPHCLCSLRGRCTLASGSRFATFVLFLQVTHASRRHKKWTQWPQGIRCRSGDWREIRESKWKSLVLHESISY